MTFAERMGHRPPKIDLQTDDMDDELRAGILNALHEYPTANFSQLLTAYYRERRWPLDRRPTSPEMCWEETRHELLGGAWYDVYTIVELAVQLEPDPRLTSRINAALQRDASAYRVAAGQLVRITSEAELDALSTAASGTTPWAEHIRTSSSLLFDRTDPDYRNSIKESISAVEAVVRFVVGDERATLGDALKKIDDLHPALRDAFSKLYGYTSDASGLRHSLVEGADPPSFEESLFMLVACAAFVNFLVGSTA